MKRIFLIAVGVSLVVAVLLLWFDLVGEELGWLLVFFIGLALLIGKSWLEDQMRTDEDEEGQVENGATILWRLQKQGYQATGIMRPMKDQGFELWFEFDGDEVLRRPYRNHAELVEAAEAKRRELEAKGWMSPAETDGSAV